MKLNLLAFAIPFFFLLMLAEYWYSVHKRLRLFSFEEAIANVNVGIVERMCDLLTTGVFYFFFVWVYENFALFNIETNWITWVILFLITDLLWYWYHRFGHEVSLLWSAHVVHHQSEDFNFTVAARITVFQAAFRSLFWAVIPLMGFAPEMTTSILLIHGIYPFFTHTQTINKLGFFEKFMVTPSHHRVHHSSNEEYLDKNYGDVLIIWDKLFGTFKAEDPNIKPIYGITTPLKSHSFLWQHFHFLLEMGVALKRAKGFKNKWLIIFGKPELIDANIRKEIEEKILSTNKTSVKSDILIRLITTKTLVTISLLFVFLLFGHEQSGYQLFIGSLYLLTSVINTGAMLEQKKWLFHIECLRMIWLCAYISLLLPYVWYGIIVLLLIGLVIIYYNKLKHTYYRFLSMESAL